MPRTFSRRQRSRYISPGPSTHALLSSIIFQSSCSVSYQMMDTLIRACANRRTTTVGPSAPTHPAIPTTATPRYTPAMFRRPQPRLATKSELSKSLLEDTKSSKKVSVLQRLSPLTQAAVRPLPPTGQPEGKALGFFDAAFLLAGSAVLSVIGGSAFLAVRYFRSR